ncbi:ribosome-recycling factor, mitochondrial [Diachasma alloeum]|uniref:ribosome-recycling factor, mitochondrial n=1 Tax=Diachasma alloeum TaxID=454923 RepID=UPI0007382B9E|nr:ribosome-recycling factor, mitochondrial [Diachasma alloeum]
MRHLFLILSRASHKSSVVLSPVQHTVRNISLRFVSRNDGCSISNGTASAVLFPQKTVYRGIERTFSVSPALGKVKQKADKKKSGKSQNVDMNELSEVINVDKFTRQMDYAVEEMKKNFMTYVSLRSSIGSIEQVVVNFEGEDFMLQELAQISRKPKVVVLNVTTFPQAIPQILDAISKSGLNLNPQQDGTTVFVPIPKITKEHREGLAKNAKALFIKCRDSLKDVRNKEIKDLKKIPSISEDQVRRVQSQLEAICDKYVKEAENLLDTKQKELLRTE